MHPLHRGFDRVLVALLLMPFLMSAATFAQSTNRQIGTQFTVTAEPLVSRPHAKPCVVQLFSNYQFAFFSQTSQTFDVTPPAKCPGPWSKVVLEADFSENAGIQFDRTASMYVANTNIYFGTTPEPLPTATNTWHVERDLTDYSVLFATAQQGTMVLQNCTTDCPPPYNTRLNGVFTVSAQLQFYPGHGDDRDSRTPDTVLPLVQTNSGGGINLPGFLFSPTDQLSTTFTLPTNIERVYLDVVSQSQSTDEQWYACFPNDLSAINDLFGCGNTNFRETEVAIDGQPAGIAPVSPWVYTGFIPDQWIPIPAAQTLQFVPYRVNLTPFAGMLNDGNPHTVAISVFNDDSYFSATASLLLFLDHGSKQVTGAVTENTLTSPSPVVSENLQGTSTVTGTIGVTSDRKFSIAGYVNTSHGRMQTTVAQHQKFSSTETIDFDTVNFTVLNQNTSVQNSVATTTTVSNWFGKQVTQENYGFPIKVNVTYPVSGATFGFTVATTQKYHTDKTIAIDGIPVYFNSLTNTVNGSDVSPAASSQKYSYFDSQGAWYTCQIASKNNTLTKVSTGCTPDEH
jgi:Peptide N-acetyl-beta-D-glucosaminyl asparaginase amidase A